MAAPYPICYLNGEYTRLDAARVSPLDRGFLFADSVYEVLPVYDGRMYRFREHFDRLARSLAEIRIASPHTHEEWLLLLTRLVAENGARTSYIYVQVTRGMEFGRNHTFPADSKPTVFALCSPLPDLTDAIRESGVSAITIQDFRWRRCDIKSTMLLANVLMKQAAAEVGANEAIIVDGSNVLEGSSTSVYVIRHGVIVTPPNSIRILPGTTRDAVLELAKNVIPCAVRSIDIDELSKADEVWISAATRDVLPVTSIDGNAVGTGQPGPLWQRMIELFEADRRKLHGTPAFDSVGAQS
ncbi:MAG TPA: D-amino acid aminotransferase [Steroidobacteraceae bacterium]|nr:D-amino acid aminotransferase [Steroidobacteraceae bacterium]